MEFGVGEYLTRDHVVPLSRGGLDTWENTVAACSTCNYRKRNRTPDEAEMCLKVEPKQPKTRELQLLRARRLRGTDTRAPG
jgi:5-methylcytosine-specific restriction endonuclease McrA